MYYKEDVFLDIYNRKIRKNNDFHLEMKKIEDAIKQAIKDGEYEITVDRLSEDAEKSLIGFGYKVSNGCVRHTLHNIRLY